MTANHILVVDDEVGIRELLFEILRDDDKRGGSRVGSGPPPNFEKTLALLERQIAHVEARRDVPAVELQIHAVRLHFLDIRRIACSWIICSGRVLLSLRPKKISGSYRLRRKRVGRLLLPMGQGGH